MKNRFINTNFWIDTYVQTLDPSEKLLFLYLLTNTHTSLCGIYEIPLKNMACDTTLDLDTVKTTIQKFENDGKILYKNGWVAIKNFIKNQNIQSGKIQKGIIDQLKAIPIELKIFVNCPFEEDEVEYFKLAKRQIVGIRDDFICAYCGKQITDSADLEMDHVLPASRGGRTTYDNLVCSCYNCNHKKGDSTALEFCGKNIIGKQYHAEQAQKKLKENDRIKNLFISMFCVDRVLSNQSTLSYSNPNTNSNPNSNSNTNASKSDRAYNSSQNKKQYLDHVYINESRYQSMCNQFGAVHVDAAISSLNAYIANNDTRYTNKQDHESIIHRWLMDSFAKGKIKIIKKDSSEPFRPLTDEERPSPERVHEILNQIPGRRYKEERMKKVAERKAQADSS